MCSIFSLSTPYYYDNYPELLTLALTHDRKIVSEELRDSVFVLIWRES